MAARKQTESARRWRAAHREQALAATRAWYARKAVEDPAWLAAKREKVRVYRKGTPLEITVENYLIDWVITLNGLCMKFVSPGQRGAPDRLVVLPGYPTFYVELKRPKLGRVGDAQKRFHQRLRDRGQRVWTLWSKDDVDAFISEVTLT